MPGPTAYPLIRSTDFILAPSPAINTPVVVAALHGLNNRGEGYPLHVKGYVSLTGLSDTTGIVIILDTTDPNDSPFAQVAYEIAVPAAGTFGPVSIMAQLDIPGEVNGLDIFLFVDIAATADTPAVAEVYLEATG